MQCGASEASAALLIRDRTGGGLSAGTMQQGFVYILSNRRYGVLYVGVTNDMSRRLTEHRLKGTPGFSKTHGLTLLVHIEEYPSIMEARAREHVLKRWRRAWKLKLVDENNPEWNDLADQLQP
jgi:putative endonuclease